VETREVEFGATLILDFLALVVTADFILAQ
jgi:hypothetical protein